MLGTMVGSARHDARLRAFAPLSRGGVVVEQVELERAVKNLTDRVVRIEQILPTLATKDDLAAAVRPLATRAEMHEAIEAAVEPLATRAEIHTAISEAGERTRHHFDAVAARLETHIRLVAEGHSALHEQMTAFRTEVKADIAGLDRRLMRLEAAR